MKKLYDDGDLLFFANTGLLSQPTNKYTFNRKTQPGLFAHNAMIEGTGRLDPHKTVLGTGILGRLADALTKNGYNTGSFAVEKDSVALLSRPGITNPHIVLGSGKIQLISLDNKVRKVLSKLHNKTESDSGIFADSWSASLIDSIANMELLENAIKSLGSTTTSAIFPNSRIGQSLETVARMVASREARGVDTDIFYVDLAGKWELTSFSIYF